MKKYLVTLTDGERRQLLALTATGKAAAQNLAHARIVLKANPADGGHALDVGMSTIARVRQRFVEQGLDALAWRCGHANCPLN
jgi:hypothetical protein